MKNARQNLPLIFRTYNLVVLLIGIISTMPILTIGIGSYRVTLFAITFAAFIVLSICIVVKKKKHRLMLGREKKLLFLFLHWPILSYLVGLIYMPSDWQVSMTSLALKTVEYIIAFLLICLIDNSEYSKSYANGLIIGFSINAIWSIAELFVFTILHKSLNNIVFAKSLATLDRASIIYNQYGGVRVSGLNYDPAHLGGIIPMLLFFGLFTKKRILIVLSIFSLVAAQSTTCLLASIAVIIFYVAYKFIYKQNNIGNILHLTKTKVYIVLLLVLVVIAFVIMFVLNAQSREAITTAISNNVNGFIGRVNNIYVSNNSTSFDSNPRRVYYGEILGALLSRNLVTFLAGTGLGTSMYAYRAYTPWVVRGGSGEPDATYIDYLFDLGIVGLSLYIAILAISCSKLVKQLRRQPNKSTIVYLGLIVVLIVVNFTYHYVFTAYQMLGLMFLTMQISNSYFENKNND